MRFPASFLVSILLVTSCGSPTGPADAPSSGATDPAGGSGLALPSTALPSATARPASPTPDASATPGSSAQVALGAGTGATVVVDGLRVRSKPSVIDASVKYTPVLPSGSNLFVIDGPVVASGYDWWQVVPTEFKGMSGPGYGWVAAASREGEPWIQAKALDCPAPPDDISALASLSDGIALGCFARQSITVRVRLLSCGCEVDGPAWEPEWLGLIYDPVLLVDPAVTKAPAVQDWFVLHIDPGAGIGQVSAGQVADVTGMFDHPAAADCLEPGIDDTPTEPSVACRFVFAVTDLRLVGP